MSSELVILLVLFLSAIIACSLTALGFALLAWAESSKRD